MPNEENTQQMNQANGNSNNGSNESVLAAIRALDARVTNPEEIIVARLNDTRPFEHKMMARLDELAAGQAAMREDLHQFRQETNQNFRLVNQKLAT